MRAKGELKIKNVDVCVSSKLVFGVGGGVESDMNSFKGMPKTVRLAVMINGTRTEFVIQSFPDKLFIIVTQIDKIAHMVTTPFCVFSETAL